MAAASPNASPSRYERQARDMAQISPCEAHASEASVCVLIVFAALVTALRNADFGVIRRPAARRNWGRCDAIDIDAHDQRAAACPRRRSHFQ